MLKCKLCEASFSPIIVTQRFCTRMCADYSNAPDEIKAVFEYLDNMWIRIYEKEKRTV